MSNNTLKRNTTWAEAEYRRIHDIGTTMTPKGARHVIDELSMRIFEIEDTETRLKQEKQRLRDRIEELEWITDPFFQEEEQ